MTLQIFMPERCLFRRPEYTELVSRGRRTARPASASRWRGSRRAGTPTPPPPPPPPRNPRTRAPPRCPPARTPCRRRRRRVIRTSPPPAPPPPPPPAPCTRTPAHARAYPAHQFHGDSELASYWRRRRRDTE